MSDLTEEELFDLSDEDLETAYKEAQASDQSPETDIETENQEFDDSNDLEEVETEDDEQPESEEVELQTDEDLDSTDNSEEEAPEESEKPESEEDKTEAAAEEETTKEKPDVEETPESEKSEQEVQTYNVRANGKDYEFTSQEIVDKFPSIFGQAMDYTKKMQAIKPWRKTIDAIETAEVSHDDVNLMIDVLKGNKDALSEVMKRTGIDSLELDTEEESKYIANDYGRDESALAIKDIVDVISQDPEYATTQNILSNEWDDKSWSSMTENPEMIKLLHTDVKSGMYKTLQPMVEKLKVYDGGRQSDLEYYKQAAQAHFSKLGKQQKQDSLQAEADTAQQAKDDENNRIAQVKAKSQQRTATKKASVKRKAAAPTKTISSSNGGVVDYLDASDNDFDDWYSKLQEDL